MEWLRCVSGMLLVLVVVLFGPCATEAMDPTITVGSGLPSWTIEDMVTQVATNQLAIIKLLSEAQTPTEDGSGVRQVTECYEAMGGLRRDLELARRESQNKDLENQQLTRTVEEQQTQIKLLQSQVDARGNVNSGGCSGLSQLVDDHLNHSQWLILDYEEFKANSSDACSRLSQRLDDHQNQSQLLKQDYEEFKVDSSDQMATLTQDLQDLHNQTQSLRNNCTNVDTTTTTEPVSFSELKAAGRVVYDPSKRFNFDAGRSFCKTKGGDLYVPRNMEDIVQLVTFLTTTRGVVYLGGRDKKWLNGEAVTGFTWKDNEKAGCIHVYYGYGNTLEADGCGARSAANSLCHIGVNYQP